jgi:hypothetical protein
MVKYNSARPQETSQCKLLGGTANVIHNQFNEILQLVVPGAGCTPWPLVRKRTIPTERPPLVGEI